jgi:Mrp family chromosome partitioning ATPase
MDNTRTERIPVLLKRSMFAGESEVIDPTCPAPWRVSEPVRAVFRRLYTSLLPYQGSSRVLAVTGLSSGAGATWITSRLACAAAEAGETVNVLDASHRDSGQLRTFGFNDMDSFRLANIYEDPASEFTDGHMTPWTKLRVFRTDSLASQGVTSDVEALELLRARSTLVLVDTEPLLGLPRIAPLTSALDGVIGVLESGRQRPRDVAEAVATLQGARPPLTGFVINKQKQVLPRFLERLL